jgi:hypothetical protein
MLKRIPKSDINIRPFKAYKEWSFNDTSTDISLYEANISSSELSNGIPKNSIYGQLRAQFYNGNEDNPFLRYGSKSNEYNIQASTRDRFLSGSAKVISIPQIYVGEGIKKGSILLTDKNGSDTSFIDDGYGNLIGAGGDSVIVGKIDSNNNSWDFEDVATNSYSGSFQIIGIDVTLNELNLVYNGVSYDLKIVSFNANTGVMIVENIPFLDGAAGSDRIGNVFYANGLLVLTREADSLLNADWELSYKSTKTIYEHEYLLIVNEDEFNVSQNPSAIVEVGRVDEYITGSDGKIYKTTTTPGVKYIRKKSILENGNTLDYRYTSSVNPSTHFAGFEHYELSGSMDSTGSFLAPFITTIGLYDDNCDLVAVAKLPQPIKSESEMPVNFIIRFDT